MSYEWAFKVIENALEKNPEFTGKFELNFFKGSIANVNKLESMKPDKKVIGEK